MTATEVPLHLGQAEGLRKLAAAVEGNAELGDLLNVVFRYLSFTVKSDAPRRLGLFAQALADAGATVDIQNGERQCTVIASFGPVKVQGWAGADSMASRYPPPVTYPPLVLESGEDTPQ